jgi:D-inositol-3-phosphate glycosyltransferase
VDGVTGLVLPADQPETLGRTLHRLLINPFRLEAMGLAGRERALSRYARARAVQATEQAYRVALGAA